MNDSILPHISSFTAVALRTMGLGLLLSATTLTFAYNDIKPGQTWNDKSGAAINAHGGCVQYSNGYYYWFGESRSGSKSNGISCYRSSDLYNWERLSKAVTPTGTMTDEGKDIASGRTLERPKVLYNAKTGKWVMWIHWENGSNYNEAKVAVLTSDKVEGPYTLVDVFRPNGCDSRDQTLFLDSNGQAYHIYSTNMNSNTNCERLTDDFLTPQPDYAVQLKGRRYEAASLFQVGETYYGLFSGCTGWNTNPGRTMWTHDLMNETWEAPADFKASDGSTGINFCVDNKANTTYDSQSNYVFQIQGKEKCFVYCGDRWNSGNIENSKHVWLPLSVRSGYPAVRWYDSWDLSVFDDMYRMKRAQDLQDGMECYFLERYSNRLVSRPKSTLTLEDDGSTNLCLILHATEDPYTWKIEDKSTGKFMQSVYGTLRWNTEKTDASQEWQFILQEDGYYAIHNASDGVTLSVSGNATTAGTSIYLHSQDADIHQKFGVYFDSNVHSAYEEADMWSASYKEENLRKMAVQTSITVVKPHEADDAVYNLQGIRMNPSNLPHGIYIVGGKKVVR